MEYKIQKLSKVNFEQVQGLFRDIYGENANIDTLKDKFQLECLDEGTLGFLAITEQNEIAAYYGVFLYTVIKNDHEIVCAQSGNTMTHAEHRKKGLFKLLHDRTMEALKAQGIPFVFGFPNSQSAPGFQKFGWTSHPAKKCTWILPLSLQKKLIRRKNWKKFYARQQKNIQPYLIQDVNNLSLESSWIQSVNPNFTILRDSRYLSYKMRLESSLIRLNSGTCWVKIQDNHLEVGDIFSSDISQTAQELFSFSHKFGIEVLETTISSTFSKKLFTSTTPNKIDRNYISLIINNLDEQATAPIVLDFSGGDFDTF